MRILISSNAPKCRCGCGQLTEWSKKKATYFVYVRGHYRKPNKYKNIDWLYDEYIRKNRTLKNIAEECDVSSQTIRKFINKFGIKTKTLMNYRHNFIGDKNRQWKGGITPESIRIRLCADSQNWRKSVFKRDNFTCRICGDNHGGNLNAHHIKLFKDYPDLRFNVDNGVTLCAPCHYVWHNKVVMINP